MSKIKMLDNGKINCYTFLREQKRVPLPGSTLGSLDRGSRETFFKKQRCLY